MESNKKYYGFAQCSEMKTRLMTISYHEARTNAIDNIIPLICQIANHKNYIGKRSNFIFHKSDYPDWIKLAWINTK